MLPMARLGLVTVMILNAVGLWNEFLLAKAYMNVNEKYTLSVGLYQFYQSMQYNSDWVSLFAGVIIIIFPILIFYLWLSDKIFEGMIAEVENDTFFFSHSLVGSMRFFYHQTYTINPMY